MRRAANANEFVDRFECFLQRYHRRAETAIAVARQRYTKEGATFDETARNTVLEAHVRTYLLNGLLASLNWKLSLESEDTYGRLLVEGPIQGRHDKHIRFIDYLGLDADEDRALIVVEAKRPGEPLPVAGGESAPSDSSLHITKGLDAPECLGRTWAKWIRQLRGYVRAIHDRTSRWPRRAVLTNGEWLVLFLNPENSFSDAGPRDEAVVRVFERLLDVESIGAELFGALAYQNVLDTVGVLTPRQVPFYLAGGDVVHCLHGLHVAYGRKTGILKLEPTIYVSPVLFLRTHTGGWYRVQESGDAQEQEIPHRRVDLSDHLAAVGNGAQCLLESVQRTLAAPLTVVGLADHYGAESEFSGLKGFVRRPAVSDGAAVYEAVTGKEPHFLRLQHLNQKCDFHSWEQSHALGQAADDAPITKRSVEPRSFFRSGEPNHCSHLATLEVKEQQVTRDNRSRCGTRSAQDGEAFCELFSMDARLCCRGCAYFDVCCQAEVFRIPCQ